LSLVLSISHRWFHVKRICHYRARAHKITMSNVRLLNLLCRSKYLQFTSFFHIHSDNNHKPKGRNKHEHQELADPTLQNHQTKNPKNRHIKPPTPNSSTNVTKTSYHKRYQRYYRGIGVSNLGIETIHKLMVKERSQLWKNIPRGVWFLR